MTRSSFSILKNGVKVWDTLIAFPSLGNSIAQLPERLRRIEDQVVCPDALGKVGHGDEGQLHPVEYEETESYKITKLFVENRERMLGYLLEEDSE